MKRIVDLTLTLRHGMRGVEFETKYTTADKGWNAQTLHLYSHCGTHADAPWHYDAGDTTIDDIPLERCIVPAWIVDFPEVQPKALLGVESLGRAGEAVQPGEGLLLRTGWSRRIGTTEYYDALPRIGPDLAEWMASKRIGVLGVEPPAVADPHNIEEITAIHRTLLRAHILIVEGLTNLEAISREKVTFIALPLKIERGDGSPVRALAIEE